MLYIKKFNNDLEINIIKNNKFISPHVFLNNSNKKINYMSKYKRVQYVGSTSEGNQYIDLGCKLIENSDDIKLQFGFIDNISLIDNAEFISCGNDSTLYGLRIRYKKDKENGALNLAVKYKFVGYASYDSSYKTYNSYLKKNLKNTSLAGETKFDIDIICNDISTFNASDHTCLLFAGRSASDVIQRFGVCKYSYMKIYKGGQIIRNLIPVVEYKTQIPGFYDIENDKFYKSNSSTELIAGPEI